MKDFKTKNGFFTGNVGIGTTNPERKLEISADNNGDTKSNYIRITDTDTTATLGAHNGGIEFYSKDSSGQPGLSAAIESIYAGSGGGGEISLSTSANSGADLVEAMRIDNSGNVGIGTTSPDYNLSVVSDTDPASIGIYGYGSFSDGTVAAQLLFLGKDSNGGNRNLAHIQVREHAHAFGTGSMEFFTRTGGNEVARMTIGSNGNVGIGTTGPSAKLVIQEDSVVNTLTEAVSFLGGNYTSASNAESFKFFHQTNTANTNRGAAFKSINGSLQIQTIVTSSNADAANNISLQPGGGNVGIGTTSPINELHVFNDTTAPRIKIQCANSSNAALLFGDLGDDTEAGILWDANTQKLHIRGYNNTNRITIDDAGNVGIGTTSPGAKLEVYGNSTGNLYPTVHNNSAGNAGWRLKNNQGDWVMIANAALRFYDVGQGLERMRIDSEGNVGIGTSNPVGKLQIAGDSTNLGGIILGHALGTGIDSFRFYIDSENRAHITRGTSERITILNTGNVGIGTTNPTDLLHVEGDDATIKIRSTATYSSTAGPRVVFQGKNSAGTTKYFGGIKSYSSGTDKGELAFNVRKNNTDTDYEAMRITSAGNVHIGTQNEDLVGADSTDADKSGFSFRAENSSGDALNYLVLARESSNAAMFINKPDQTTSQTSHYIDFRNSGTTVGRLGYDGTDVSITQDSDERLKTNIKDSESGLNIINGLQVRSFDWVNDSRKSKKFGFIAQEMHEVFEDAVRVGGEDPQEDAWAISESKLIPVLTKAIQEQQTIIEDLKSQNESLIARIEALEG